MVEPYLYFPIRGSSIKYREKFTTVYLFTINTNTAVMRTSEVQAIVINSMKVSEMLSAHMVLHVLKIVICYKAVFH
jgi:hypothetical protein